VHTVRSFCRICTTLCGIVVDVSGDRVMTVCGDRRATWRVLVELGRRLAFVPRRQARRLNSQQYSGIPVTLHPSPAGA
jgi:anaerobic selenocysteine-containing dehydrogenase